MMDEAFASNYLPLIANYIKGEFVTNKLPLPELNDRNSICVSADGGNDGRTTIDNAPEGSIAIINFSGAITMNDQECGPAGCRTKSNILKQCYNNDNISAVVLVIGSGGGEAYAMRLVNETIGMKNKTVGAFIDDMACSAAYGIASGCDYICANSEWAQIGSIGTFFTIMDMSKRLEMLGVKVIEIYATQSTDKNKDFRDAIAGKPEALKAVCDVFNEYFISIIESNRGDKLTADRKVWGTGKVYMAQEALDLGLIDGIDTFENFLNYFK